MRIATLQEQDPETRVAITPHSARALIKAGFEVAIQKHAGLSSGFTDGLYEQAGVQIINTKKNVLKQTNILLCVNEPTQDEIEGLPLNALLIAPIQYQSKSPLISWCQKQHITLISMNAIPRISRAQNLDSLSSQANLAGYRAVLEAASLFHRAIPMMMTAAGMIQPAKVLILGAGVAGLQAIATAKRLGAVVYAFDVRTAAKEQVESLGAEFIEVDKEQNNETKDGYASESTKEYQALQAQLIDTYAKMADIVIATALIPNQKAPVLLHKKTIEQMKPGSVIVDLATSQGGNCELSVRDKIIKHGDIIIVGVSNLARLIPATASDLYANNVLHLIQLLSEKNPGEIIFNAEDVIIQQATLCHNGHYLPFTPAKESKNA